MPVGQLERHSRSINSKLIGIERFPQSKLVRPRPFVAVLLIRMCAINNFVDSLLQPVERRKSLRDFR